MQKYNYCNLFNFIENINMKPILWQHGSVLFSCQNQAQIKDKIKWK
jgi:hypothetical protein